MGVAPAGRLSLRLDAMYCALGALALALFAGPVSARLAVPWQVTAAVAAGVGVWAFALHRLARRARLRPYLVMALVANTGAAALMAAYAATRPWRDLFTVLLVAVAIEVAAFAVSQAVALRRPRTSAP